MADFHFFSHSAAIKGSGGEANGGIPFGFLSSGRYIVSSMFVADDNYTPNGGKPPAIAITTGKIFCIEVPRSNKTFDATMPNELVDIIFKPIPGSHPNWCPKVKYFIYRSVLKSSLVELPNGTTEYVFSADVPQNMRNKFIDPTNLGLKNGVSLGDSFFDVDNGVDPIQIGKKLDYIFDSKFLNINILEVSAGDLIGLFPEHKKFGTNPTDEGLNKFGLDILLDQHFYNPTIGEVLREYTGTPTNLEQYTHRANRIEFNTTAGTPTPAEKLENKFNSEKIKAYIDPAAFYGSFVTAHIAEDTGHKLFENGTQIDFDGGGSGADKFRDFYERIFIGTENVNNNPSESKYLFENKNRLYFDIRDETGLSININDRYNNGTDSNHFSIEWKEQTTPQYLDIPTRMFNNAYDFSILYLQNVNGDFLLNSNTSLGNPINPSEDAYEIPHDDITVANGNEVRLGIKFRKHIQDNEHEFKYSLIVDFGIIEGQKAEPLRIPLDVNESTDNFIDEIVLKLPHYKHSVTSSNNLKVICQYVKITLVAHNTNIVLPSNTNLNNNFIEPLEYFDNVIPLSVLDSLPTQTLDYKVSNNLNRATYLNNLRMDGSDGMADFGMFHDFNDITFFAYIPKKLGRNEISNKLDISTALIRTPPTLSAKDFTIKAVELINSQDEASDYRIVRATDESINDGGNKDINLLQKFNPNEKGGQQAFSQNGTLLNGFNFFQISKIDWETYILSLYNQNDLNQSSANPSVGFFHKASTFLAFQFVSFTAAGPASYAKYQILLRSYYLNSSGTVEIREILCPNCFVYILNQGYDISSDNNFIDTNAGKKHIDYSQAVNTSQVLDNEHKSAHTHQLNGSTHELESEIVWIRGLLNDVQNQQDMQTHFDGLNRAVFDSTINEGINHLLPTGESSTISLSYRNAYPGEMLKVTPEVGYFSLYKNLFDERASVEDSTRKAGLLYIPNNYANQQDLFAELQMEVVHEFAHMLGLTDRYAYLGRVFDNGTYWAVEDESPSPTAPERHPQNVSIDIGTDIGYSDKYRWHFNLMSGGDLYVSAKSIDTDSPFFNQTTFNSLYSNLTPLGTAPNFIRFTTYFSQQQWEIIKNRNLEQSFPDAHRLIFVKRVAVNNSYYGKVTFFKVGITKADPHSTDMLFTGTNAADMLSRNTFASNSANIFAWLAFGNIGIVAAETASQAGKENYQNSGLLNEENRLKLLIGTEPSPNIQGSSEYFMKGSPPKDFRGQNIQSDNYNEFRKVTLPEGLTPKDLIQQGGLYLYNDEETTFSTEQPLGYKIKYDQHLNRISILKLISGGGL